MKNARIFACVVFVCGAVAAAGVVGGVVEVALSDWFWASERRPLIIKPKKATNPAYFVSLIVPRYVAVAPNMIKA